MRIGILVYRMLDILLEMYQMCVEVIPKKPFITKVHVIPDNDILFLAMMTILSEGIFGLNFDLLVDKGFEM